MRFGELSSLSSFAVPDCASSQTADVEVEGESLHVAQLLELLGKILEDFVILSCVGFVFRIVLFEMFDVLFEIEACGYFLRDD